MRISVAGSNAAGNFAEVRARVLRLCGCDKRGGRIGVVLSGEEEEEISSRG